MSFLSDLFWNNIFPNAVVCPFPITSNVQAWKYTLPGGRGRGPCGPAHPKMPRELSSAVHMDVESILMKDARKKVKKWGLCFFFQNQLACVFEIHQKFCDVLQFWNNWKADLHSHSINIDNSAFNKNCTVHFRRACKLCENLLCFVWMGPTPKKGPWNRVYLPTGTRVIWQWLPR